MRGSVIAFSNVRLHLSDSRYTERLASFLQSLAQIAVVSGPDRVELLAGDGEPTTRPELEIYLRVWRVLYPDAVVEIEDDPDHGRGPRPRTSELPGLDSNQQPSA